jgi:hypothetical protein
MRSNSMVVEFFEDEYDSLTENNSEMDFELGIE